MKYHATNDEEKIRTLIEAHGGSPAIARGSSEASHSLGIIWNGATETLDRELEAISWEEFFDWFETGNLSFKYAENGEGASSSLSYDFISRDSIASLNNQEFIFPEENEMVRENIFSSAPASEEGDMNSENA